MITRFSAEALRVVLLVPLFSAFAMAGTSGSHDENVILGILIGISFVIAAILYAIQRYKKMRLADLQADAPGGLAEMAGEDTALPPDSKPTSPQATKT